MSSILMDVRIACGVDKDDDSFDSELIQYINSDLTENQQLADIGTPGFVVTDLSETWEMYNPVHVEVNPMIALLVGKRVKLNFDPPQSSQVMQSMKDTIERLEYRLNYQLDILKED